jgi:hypothetical protein
MIEKKYIEKGGKQNANKNWIAYRPTIKYFYAIFLRDRAVTVFSKDYGGTYILYPSILSLQFSQANSHLASPSSVGAVIERNEMEVFGISH